MASVPKFSVIIATYNWSSALRLALESVRAQTLDDFEVIVVGDGCTDDSEAVVAAFGDHRFSWCNLAENCGSQWGPNNHGLSLARGEYIAYLGHDDLWWSTHLEVASANFDKTGADVLAAATLLYGPPESGIRAVSGFFPHGVYSPRIFFPPSSLLHRKDLALRIGGWLAPEQTQVAVDFDFLIRLHAAGARFAATGEFTAFKFTTAWRRDAYRVRDVSQQSSFLARTQQEGEAFRRQELSASLHAAVEDRLRTVDLPVNATAANFRLAIQEFKGSRRKTQQPAGQWIDGRLRFLPDNNYQGFEWHALEEHPSIGNYRWSGPSTRSSVILPVKIGSPLTITLLLVGWMTEESLHAAKLEVNDVELETRLEACGAGKFLWHGRIAPEGLPANDREDLRLMLVLNKTHRPLDLGISDDWRWLGLAVGWVEISGLIPQQAR